MKFNSYDASSSQLDTLISDLNSNDELFILVYMDGCGPCNRMKPSWHNLKPQLEEQYKNRDDIAIIDVERTHLPRINELQDVEGFPTIKYINKKKGKNELYDGQRSTDELIKWIEQNIDHVNSEDKSVPESLEIYEDSGKDSNQRQISLIDLEKDSINQSTSSSKKKSKRNKKRKKTQSGGKRMKKKPKTKKKGHKWSLKYKRSINCKKPKGFSQKQYCKYK